MNILKNIIKSKTETMCESALALAQAQAPTTITIPVPDEQSCMEILNILKKSPAMIMSFWCHDEGEVVLYWDDAMSGNTSSIFVRIVK